jgi:glutathione peroxidase
MRFTTNLAPIAPSGSRPVVPIGFVHRVMDSPESGRVNSSTSCRHYRTKLAHYELHAVATERARCTGVTQKSGNIFNIVRAILALIVFLLTSPVTAAACPPLLDLKLPTLTEDAASLCRYQGKVLLVVNTASQCGYTPQYEGLEKIYRRYKDEGLVVIGFPSNDFGGQEPGSNKEIAKFCEINYGVSFPMFAKSAVAKGTINPFYERLAQASNSRPRWNFHKYLVDRKGEKVLAYESATEPGDRKLVTDIERLLAQP